MKGKEYSVDQASGFLKERMEGLRETRWWIITGGPHTGKSSVIKNLAERGYKTVQEAARNEIESGFDKGRTIEEIRADEVEFQRRVLRVKENREDNVPEEELVFWDRGLHGDSAAYWMQTKGPNGTTVDQFDYYETVSVLRRRYKGIFLLDQLPFYQKDEARVEDREQGRRIHLLIGSIYSILGYEPISVPVFPGSKIASINQRAQFIIDQVRKADVNVPNFPYPFPIPAQSTLSI